MSIYEKIHECGIIPVIKLENPEKSVALGKALLDGGINCAEVTFRTATAAETIKRMSDAFPEMTVGAGTVLTTDQAQKAVWCGAQFIVSPGLNPKVLSWCIDRNIPVIPGIATPTELEAALDLGLTTVKFFPAEAFGGLKTLKAISAPYGNVRFMPTGGISLENMESYLSFSKIIACGGSFMVTGDLIEKEDYGKITELSRAAVDIVRKCRQNH